MSRQRRPMGCGGYGSRSGHCGATDCPTCYPASWNACEECGTVPDEATGECDCHECDDFKCDDCDECTECDGCTCDETIEEEADRLTGCEP